MAHPTGATHTSYAGNGGGGSSGGQPAVSQHGRGGPPLTLSHYPHLSPAGHPSVPPHMAASAAAATTAYLEQQAALRLSTNSAGALSVAPQSSASSQASYPAHHAMLAQHPHLLQQYQPIHNLDLMWQQKYQPPAPATAWMLHQYQEGQERLMQEHQIRLERDRREQAERMEREKLEKERQERERREQDKQEKEKLERERAQKERIERERYEQERLKKERAEKELERLANERAHRDVRQPFEDPYRGMNHKSISSHWTGLPAHSMPSVSNSESISMSSHVTDAGSRTSSRGSTSVIHIPAELSHPQQHSHQHHLAATHHHHQVARGGKEPRDPLEAKEARLILTADGEQHYLHSYPVAEEQRRSRDDEKWLVMQQHQEVSQLQQQQSRSRHKAEYPVTTEHAHGSHGFSGPKSGSATANPMSGTKADANPNFNPYGYQPFQHSYIHQERVSSGPVGPSSGANTSDLIKSHVHGGLDPNKVPVTGAMTQTVAPSHQRRSGSSGHGSSAVAYMEHDRRQLPVHNSVIVSSENMRPDGGGGKGGMSVQSSSSKQHLSLLPQHQQQPQPPQPKVVMSHGTPHGRTSPGYPQMGSGNTAFKPYEYGHGHCGLMNEAQLPRVIPPHLAQPHQEPQNFHKTSALSDPYSQCRSSVQTSPTAPPNGGYGNHVLTSGMVTMPSVSSSHGHVIAKTVPASFSSNLIQQGLVPNPIYNQASPSGGSRGPPSVGALSSHSPNSTSSSTSAQSLNCKSSPSPNAAASLPLPARSSPAVPYGKASIVTGTPMCRQPASIPQQPLVAPPMSPFHQTPPPAHHNGSRSQAEHSRPPSVHSRPSSGPTPPSRTTTPGQTSHSPLDRGGTGRATTPLVPSASPHLQLTPAGYSSPRPPSMGSPHVPSPLPLTSTPSSFVLLPRSSSSSSSCEGTPRSLVSPPQTQPLDLQAPDRRDRHSPSPGKRRTAKESPTRKRHKATVMGVANEGLAAAVASAHQILSSAGATPVGSAPSPARVSAPLPLVAGATTAITTVVNAVALDTLTFAAEGAGQLQSRLVTNLNSVQQATGVANPKLPNLSATATVTCPNRESGFLNSYRSFVHSSQQQQQQSTVYPDYQAYSYGKHKSKQKAAAKLASSSRCSSPTPSISSCPNDGSFSDPSGGPTTTNSVTVSAGCASSLAATTTTTTTSTPTATMSTTATVTLTRTTATPPPSLNRLSASSPAQSTLNGPSEPDKAISPALSTSSTCSSNPIPKLKKEWLIRHSNEDCKSSSIRSEVSETTMSTASSSSSSCSLNTTSSSIQPANPSGTRSPEGDDGSKPGWGTSNNRPPSSLSGTVNGHTPVKQEGSTIESGSSLDDSEADSVSTNSASKSSCSKRKTRSNKPKSSDKRLRTTSDSQSEKGLSKKEEDTPDEDLDVQSTKTEASQKRRRGRKPKSKSARAEAVRKTKSSKLSSSKSERISLARLKRTGESFLQKGPCYEVAPKLSKCRECRMTHNQRSKKLPNIFCRFYEFRRLRYSKNGVLMIAGFSKPQDATEEDLRLWLPLVDDPPPDLEVPTSEFIVNHVGDQFCDLVEQEREAQAMHLSDDKTIAWKRVVQGVREMCDVCETTLFNIHWACGKCGFVVCIDCYKARRNGTVKEEDNPVKDRDEYSWLLCNSKQAHEQEKLILTQIIAGNALWDMGKWVHEIRKKWGIPTYCSCTRTKSDIEAKPPTVNGICKQLMSAVTKYFDPAKHTEPCNGGTESIKANSKKLIKGNNNSGSVNGCLEYIKKEGVAGYNPDSASPLSWLADVALNSSVKMTDSTDKCASNKDKSNEKTNPASKSGSHSDGSDAEDGKMAENYSTLRELLIRPTSKNNNGAKNSSATSNQKKKMNRLDEVISHVIEQSVNSMDKKEKPAKEEMKLIHYMRRFPQSRSGRELLPIRVFTLEESNVLYPGVPHSWLCSGRLLRLLDPYHKGNLKLFQEQWKRGQPIVVSEVNKSLNMNLWHPEAFANDFGDIKNDLVNCSNGTIVAHQPMRKFWEGFETFSKRMKDDNGEYMLLKLKDWPPGDDFSEMLPSRFEDLMQALPLPEYTHRNGLLNMAGRLPECFVRPDLGPKMYNAYGSAVYPDKGTTNLHLDISDAVNVMVYVGIPKDGDNDQHLHALKAIEEGGCDILTQRRVRDAEQKPGALWHIYNARDADKIRDLLNKVAIERGEKLEAHHDPIHDQSWYLDGILRERLYKEYNVEGYAIAQCLGDAVFIPAGAPHQVRNLHSCIKVAEDFVSPENISHCFTLTQEFRDLSDTHTNHEDKLQVKNIIYHAVRDALALLMGNDPVTAKKTKSSKSPEQKK